ncbi:MAG: hypothetical protein ABI675_14920 [Chitinophagaceae bacterium]
MSKELPGNSDLITFSEFREFMFENIVPINDIVDFKGIPVVQILPFWRKNDLIPFIQKGMHLKISFAELIWIRILDTLRQFSYPVEQIRRVCDYFFKDALDNDLPKKNWAYNQKYLLDQKRRGVITEEESLMLVYLDQFMKDKVLLKMMNSDINYLTNLVTDCIRSGEERTILIFADGRVGESDGAALRTHGNYQIDRTEPHICLSILHYLKEFIKSDQLSKIFLPQMLNDNEKKVLKYLKQKNISQLTIKFSADNDVTFIPSKKGIITGTEMEKIKQVLGLSNYEEITLSTLDKTKLSFVRTKKKI